MKNECKIIRDLLPLVEENIASRESCDFVREHISSCEECKNAADELKNSAVSFNIEDDVCNTENCLKFLKRKLNLKKLITISLTSLVTAAAVVLLGYYLLIGGHPASSDNFEITTEFQYDENAYLNQSFALTIKRKDGKPLWISSKSFTSKENDGVEITVKEVPVPIIPEPDNYTSGYSYGTTNADDIPSDDYNFKFVIKFSDRSVVYSMREEGLFEIQENIIDYTEN